MSAKIIPFPEPPIRQEPELGCMIEDFKSNLPLFCEWLSEVNADGASYWETLGLAGYTEEFAEKLLAIASKLRGSLGHE